MVRMTLNALSGYMAGITAMLVSVVTVMACDVFSPDTFAEPALIVFFGDSSLIEAPDSVTSGTSFRVSVATFAGGCTREIDRTELDVSGNVAEIRPYNRTRQSDVCTRDLIFLVHTVTVNFDRPGLGTVRVRGEQRPLEGDARRTGLATLERQVLVR